MGIMDILMEAINEDRPEGEKFVRLHSEPTIIDAQGREHNLNGRYAKTAPLMSKLILIHKGRDSWDRPVYECEGRLYVDVDPRSGRKPEICTKHGNQFEGEPDTPIAEGIEVEFIPCRDTW